jgi:hypothetical protein
MTVYGVWLEPYENFSKRWETEARSPAEAVKNWRRDADPPNNINWDDPEFGDESYSVTVCKMGRGYDTPDDFQGETVTVLIRREVTVKWHVGERRPVRSQGPTNWWKVELLK